jgi:hypothetical protein
MKPAEGKRVVPRFDPRKRGQEREITCGGDKIEQLLNTCVQPDW